MWRVSVSAHRQPICASVDQPNRRLHFSFFSSKVTPVVKGNVWWQRIPVYQCFLGPYYGGEGDIDIVHGRTNCDDHTVWWWRWVIINRVGECNIGVNGYWCRAWVWYRGCHASKGGSDEEKESVSSDEIRRRITQWGLHKPTGTRNKVSNYTFKHMKCPTKTVMLRFKP